MALITKACWCRIAARAWGSVERTKTLRWHQRIWKARHARSWGSRKLVGRGRMEFDEEFMLDGGRAGHFFRYFMILMHRSDSVQRKRWHSDVIAKMAWIQNPLSVHDVKVVAARSTTGIGLPKYHILTIFIRTSSVNFCRSSVKVPRFLFHSHLIL